MEDVCGKATCLSKYVIQLVLLCLIQLPNLWVKGFFSPLTEEVTSMVDSPRDQKAVGDNYTTTTTTAHVAVAAATTVAAAAAATTTITPTNSLLYYSNYCYH